MQHRDLALSRSPRIISHGPDSTYAAENRKAVRSNIANSIATNTIIMTYQFDLGAFFGLIVFEAGVGHSRDHQAAECECDRHHEGTQHAR